MVDYIAYMHYGIIALTVSINAVSVALGQGLTGSAAIDAINRQPQAKNDITKIAILSTALIETSAILGIAISIFLLFGTHIASHTLYKGIAQLGIGFALCFSGFIVGLASGGPARAACYAMARQPFFGAEILRFMLITISLIQTPTIFGFIIAIFIRSQIASVDTLADALRLIGSGLAVGLGSIGPALGLAQFAKAACQGIGINRTVYAKLLSFTFISQAIIETPAIFALVIGLMLVFTTTGSADTVATGIAFLSAGLCIGLGTLGAGIGSGRASAAACRQIALNPSLHSSLSKVSMFVQGIIDTAAVYALLIAMLIYLFR